MLPRRFVSILMALSAAYAGLWAGGLEGLRGRELLEAVGAAFHPASYRQSMASPGGVWEAFRSTDALPGGFVKDCFSNAAVVFPADGYSSPPSMEAACVVPPEWWGLRLADDAPVSRDLHNLFPAALGVGETKKNYPPGTVTTAFFDNGIWKSGIGFIDGVEVNMYQPPKGMEGDFARVVMYIVAVYPCGFWLNLGENFLMDNYPVLQPWAMRQLMAWHHSDPVSDSERCRSEAVALLQGNTNPFVTNPSLADFIWGDKAGDPYEPDDPAIPERVPLRSRYSLADPRIDLYSPYIPDGARWWVDGEEVTAGFVVPERLGAGIHELRFSATGVDGKLKITVQ